MTERTRSPNTAELDQYIAEARRLRNEEIARLRGQLFHAPRRLLKRARHQVLFQVRTS